MNVKKSLIFWLVLYSQAWGYVYSGDTAVWQPGSIPFQIKLGSGTTLQDGTNHSTSVQAAMTSWNAQLGTVQFAPTIVAQSSSTDTDHEINEIVFNDTIEGDAFGENVVAVTLSYSYPSVHKRTESDIFFNTAYTWDSYRGPWQGGPGVPKDIRRVALHELGHALGLGHPDEQGQPGTIAVMNSIVGDTDKLEADDIAGAQFLYRVPGNTAPAANNAFASATMIDLSNNAAVATGTNYYATKEAGEPKHDGYLGGKSVWWKWTAPKNGSVSLTTQGSYFDTLLAVYTGSAVSALSVVASNDQASDGVSYSSLTFNATSGTTYFIAVDGWDGESGFVSLSLTFVPVVETSPPVITSHPAPQSVNVAQTATFSGAASGYPAPTYQWQRLPAAGGLWSNLGNGTYYDGVTTGTLTVSGATISLNGDRFRCVATNSAGTATSNPALLSVTMVVDAVSSVSAGSYHTLFVKPNGTLWGTGWNNNGQLGDGTLTERNSPVLVAGNVASASAGYTFSMFVKSDGTLWGMGANENGSLGDGTTTLRTIPVQVATDVRCVGAGGSHTMFIKTDGTLWGVGDNSNGQLGDGTTSRRLMPVQVASNVASVAVGFDYTLYLKTDGTLWAMGNNNVGQLGDGSTTQRSTPVQIATAVASVSAGSNHTLFVKTDGTLWATGQNSEGKLGDGTETRRFSPVLIARDVASVSAGWNHTMFLKRDGTLWAMGDPSYGARGDGTLSHRTTPVQVASQVRSMSAGSQYSMFILTNQTLWGVGNNISGWLGFKGSNNYEMLPVQVVPFVPGLPLIEVQPLGQTASAGSPITLTVTARSTLPATYQWQKNGVNIPGATSSSLSIAKVRPADAGSYTVITSTAAGSTTTAAAMLLVNDATPDFNGDGHSDILWQNTTTGERAIWFMNGSTLLSGTSLGLVPTEWSIAAATDFNGDGHPDILWQNTTTGERSVWFMSGSTLLSGTSLGFVPTEWSIAAANDFNGDGYPDILWQNTTTGERSVWFMNGTTTLSGTSLGLMPIEWSIVAANDFNGDGHPDILWQNTTTSESAVWFMNGTTLLSGASLGLVHIERSIAAANDFNGDGYPDILWQNTTTGERSVWFMNGTTTLSSVSLGPVPTEWSIAGSLRAMTVPKTYPLDFNGDGHPDILWQNTITGERVVWFMNGTTTLSGTSLGFMPTEWSIAATTDFNGDGRPDILWQNTATGERSVRFMNGTTTLGGTSLGLVPIEWSIAAATDFNSDGHPDIVWQNTTTGERAVWFMSGSTMLGGTSLGLVPTAWSIAAANDFNGDGHPDILWQNTTTGERSVWFLNGTTTLGGTSLGLVPTEWSITAANDFNGDGHPDIFWQNTTTGERAVWFLNGTTTLGGTSLGLVPTEWSMKD